MHFVHSRHYSPRA